MTTEETLPPLGSEEWTNYWVGKLYPNEMTDAFPSTDGLRRLFFTHFARVEAVDIDVVQAPTVEQRRATVKCSIVYKPKTPGAENLVVGETRRISDVADCYWGNTKEPFSHHATATAATIAEGRCYRKAMFLRTMTQEETLSPTEKEFNSMNTEHEDGLPATDNQTNTIKRMTERLKIDLQSFIKYMNEDVQSIKTENIDNISSFEAKVLLKKLGQYQRKVAEGGEQIPECILLGEAV